MKNPSIALSKTTTLSSASVSIAVMILFSCGIVFGPKTFRGGLFNVTRQYAGECLVRKTRFSFMIKAVIHSIRPTFTHYASGKKRFEERRDQIGIALIERTVG